MAPEEVLGLILIVEFFVAMFSGVGASMRGRSAGAASTATVVSIAPTRRVGFLRRAV